jgi:hypothetical protein
MSLISDALKKARQEAARQDALRQSTPYAVGAADPPARNPWLPLLAGLGAGCGLALVLFVVAWIACWGPFARTAPPRVAEVQVPAVQPVQPAPAVTIEEQPPSVAPPEVPQAAIPEITAAPPPLQPEPDRPQPAPVQAPAPSSIQVTPSSPPPQQPAPEPQPAPAEPASTPVQEEPAEAAAPSYVREVPVPGGGTLTLNGIAYSPDRPIAVVDGNVVGPGEVVQGFTVVEIQANRLKLQRDGATVYVSLK